MLFATTIIPILDSAAAVLMTGLEVIKGKWAAKVAEYNYQISKIGDVEPKSRAIGFAAPVEEDEYEED